ncbi:MAG TPA: amidohydrolase family protein [Acidimicrobiales bacterium]|nr:amidohydrolase family protein [Acidimicrobiales bacterium]
MTSPEGGGLVGTAGAAARRDAAAGIGPGTPRAVRLVADCVVTMDDETRVFRPGALELVGDRIAWVGPADEAPRGSPGEAAAGDAAWTVTAPGAATDVRHVGGLLMPGLVNAHGHSPMTLLRGAGDGLPLDRWLAEAIWPREARLSPEDVFWGMLLGSAELLRAGVTTTCELYLHSRAVADAAAVAGVRCVLTPGIFDLPGAGPAATWRRCLEDAARLHADLSGRDPGLTVGLGPHSAYTLPPEALVAVATVAGELDALVHVHVAETREEGEVVRARHGCGAPEALRRAGLLDCRLLAAHAVWLDDTELGLFARHDVAVAHCPQSNAKLGSGVADVPGILARGIRVGLGTDGPASNDNLDLWEELRLAPLLARAVARDASALGTVDALSLATRGGAAALGLACGALAPGRFADVVRVELEDAAFVPAEGNAHLLTLLVWAASSRLVTDVWVGGRHVVVGGECLSVDEPRARREVADRARRLCAG